MYMYFLNHCFQAPTWCSLSLYKSQEAHLQYKRDTQVYKLLESAHHYPQWMILLVEAKWTPGGGEEFFLGLTNFHVATAVALFLVKLFLSLRLYFIITARLSDNFSYNVCAHNKHTTCIYQVAAHSGNLQQIRS